MSDHRWRFSVRLAGILAMFEGVVDAQAQHCRQLRHYKLHHTLTLLEYMDCHGPPHKNRIFLHCAAFFVQIGTYKLTITQLLTQKVKYAAKR